MKPVKKPHSNIVLKAPQNWDAAEHGECLDLHATRHEGMFFTYWKAGFKERLKILFGGSVRLCVISNSFAPGNYLS